MGYKGQSAIAFLAGEVRKEDTAASSHWKKYHTGFHFTGDDFNGLQGFGSLEKPYRGFNWIGHRILQARFRKMGAAYPSFAKLDALNAHIARKQKKAYSLDVLRQTLTLAFLKQHIPVKVAGNGIAWVIGDGFASMTCLLHASQSVRTIVLVNLTKTLLVDLWYLKQWLGEEVFDHSVELITGIEEARAISEDISVDKPGIRIIAIQATDHDLLNELPADIVINIVSMQEMDPPVIAGYFANIHSAATKRPVHFYCCNREEKSLPDGTITRIADYPWEPNDKVLVNELCPWHQQYYLLNPPFYRPYDGPIRHQLRSMLDH